MLSFFFLSSVSSVSLHFSVTTVYFSFWFCSFLPHENLPLLLHLKAEHLEKSVALQMFHFPVSLSGKLGRVFRAHAGKGLKLRGVTDSAAQQGRRPARNTARTAPETAVCQTVNLLTSIIACMAIATTLHNHVSCTALGCYSSKSCHVAAHSHPRASCLSLGQLALS